MTFIGWLGGWAVKHQINQPTELWLVRYKHVWSKKNLYHKWKLYNKTDGQIDKITWDEIKTDSK